MFNGRTALLYDAAMNILRDWKWNAALAVFALFAAFVVWWPGPGAGPEVARAAPEAEESHDAAAEMPLVRPEPTPAENEAMLQYTVQEGDTVAGIARVFVVSEEDLRWANRVPNGGDLTPGRAISIPAP